MNSPAALAAESAGVRPTRTPAFEQRLARRYRAERNFRLMGLSAVVLSVAVLVFLLGNMFINGLAGFQRAEMPVTINFADDGIARIAAIAADVNERVENIGARRLQTIMEKLLEEVSFGAENMNGVAVTIDRAYVDSQLSAIAGDTDLSKYIL